MLEYVPYISEDNRRLELYGVRLQEVIIRKKEVTKLTRPSKHNEVFSGVKEGKTIKT